MKNFHKPLSIHQRNQHILQWVIYLDNNSHWKKFENLTVVKMSSVGFLGWNTMQTYMFIQMLVYVAPWVSAML